MRKVGKGGKEIKKVLSDKWVEQQNQDSVV